MTPNLHGWEAFSTPKALTHISITRAFLPMAPQFLDVTMGSPLYLWCCGHFSLVGRQYKNGHNDLKSLP